MSAAQRSRRAALRATLGAILLIVAATPALARDPGISVEAAAVMDAVTAGQPMAFEVTVSNAGPSTVNHIVVEGETSVPAAYLGSDSPICASGAPVCDVGKLKAGQTATATLYFLAPESEGGFTFTAVAHVGEGQNDTPNAAHRDLFTGSAEVTLLEPGADRIAGFSLPDFRTFTTGLENLGEGNPHGTTVTVSTNTTVDLSDVGPDGLPCPAELDDQCRGSGSELHVGGGQPFPNGFEVTIRWDASELGFEYYDYYSETETSDLRIVHILDDGSYELVDQACEFNEAGAPTNLPCIADGPTELDDGDVQVTIWLLQNGLVRGW